jgi:hypothetical protein
MNRNNKRNPNKIYNANRDSSTEKRNGIAKAREEMSKELESNSQTMQGEIEKYNSQSSQAKESTETKIKEIEQKSSGDIQTRLDRTGGKSGTEKSTPEERKALLKRMSEELRKMTQTEIKNHIAKQRQEIKSKIAEDSARIQKRIQRTAVGKVSYGEWDDADRMLQVTPEMKHNKSKIANALRQIKIVGTAMHRAKSGRANTKAFYRAKKNGVMTTSRVFDKRKKGDTGKIKVCVCVDTSGSMNAYFLQGISELVWEIGMAFKSQGHTVKVYTFDEEPHTTVMERTKTTQLNSVGGSTEFYPLAPILTNEFANAQEKDKLLIVITDAGLGDWTDTLKLFGELKKYGVNFWFGLDSRGVKNIGTARQYAIESIRQFGRFEIIDSTTNTVKENCDHLRRVFMDYAKKHFGIK